MKSFYMTLLSTSSKDYFPGNTAASFSVQLPRHYNLEGDWEGAMAEIHYPYTMVNVEQTMIKLETVPITDEFYSAGSNGNDISKFINTSTKSSTHHIGPGHYDTVENIVKAVNNIIAKATRQPAFFIFDPLSNTVTCVNSIIKGGKWISYCTLSKNLALQLGYNDDGIIRPDGKAAPYPVNQTMMIPEKMLIYCNILEPQIIGDSWGRVLRLVNTFSGLSRPAFGQGCHEYFNTLQYIPIQIKNFESITIDIKDINGQHIPFQYGTLSVKLHFRKKH